MCRSMRDMAMIKSAIPLVNNDGDISDNESKGFLTTYGWGSRVGTETWESRSVFGCVCDSSWEVRSGASADRAAAVIPKTVYGCVKMFRNGQNDCCKRVGDKPASWFDSD